MNREFIPFPISALNSSYLDTPLDLYSLSVFFCVCFNLPWKKTISRLTLNKKRSASCCFHPTDLSKQGEMTAATTAAAAAALAQLYRGVENRAEGKTERTEKTSVEIILPSLQLSKKMTESMHRCMWARGFSICHGPCYPQLNYVLLLARTCVNSNFRLIQQKFFALFKLEDP